ncbi:MAG TPA: type IV pilus modification protein PilV [Steroidobacteraceae bacterium]
MRMHIKEQGVGLIEVLVAVLILSIGMLGLAGLQMRTLRNSQSSLERGVAVVETHFIADAMRADLLSVEDGDYNIGLTDDPPTTPATFAEKAIASWRSNIEANMGDGATGSIDCNGRDCNIIIQWNDSRGSGNAADIAEREEFQIATQVRL